MRAHSTMIIAALIGMCSSCNRDASDPTEVVAEAADPAAPQQRIDRTVADVDIEAAIREEFGLDGGVENRRIEVNVKDGVVTLAGEPSSLLAKKRALKLASAVRGVRAIVDRLHVAASDADDDEIQRKVEQALLVNPTTESFDANVVVNDGVVTLTGEVQSWPEKDVTGDVASGVRGVRAVVNNLHIDFGAERPDVELEQDIRSQLRRDVRVDEGLVRVAVADGVAKLSGIVGSVAERRRAKEDARIFGVRDVDASGIRIEWWARDRMQRAAIETPTDSEIEEAVHDTLRLDPRVDDANVRYYADDGVVTLVGEVASLAAKYAAEADAENTTGVWRAKNYLWVRPAEEVADYVLDDRVRAALAMNPHLDTAEDIDVTVKQGVVRLAGRVDTAFERAAATRVASLVKGVRGVKNALLVADDEVASALVPDRVLADRIRSQLDWDPYVSTDDVHAQVMAGVATLQGTVRTWFAYRRALDAAHDAGVSRVIDQLRVRHGPKVLRPKSG
jgi:osmotically-inducible protein OsmY